MNREETDLFYKHTILKRLIGGVSRPNRRQLLAAFAAGGVLVVAGVSQSAFAQDRSETLIVAGPRTPESLDQEYPPTEATHEMRKNLYERLLSYELVEREDGIRYEDFDSIVGALAETWEVSDDKKSITFHLREDVLSAAGNRLDADDVMWSFKRGWNLEANFHWYMTQVLKIESFEEGFEKIDDMTVRVKIPNPSPLIEAIWVNNDLGILDSDKMAEHTTQEDPWGSRWLATNSASFGPYEATRYSPGQEVIYEANENYYRGVAPIKRVIFKEMPTSSNRVSALQAGAVDVAEWLLPRELAFLESMPDVEVKQVFGNYIHRVEMNNDVKPFDNPTVRQAMNYLVPRESIAKAVYHGTARPTHSPVSEIYPGFVGEGFPYDYDPARAKELLSEAGYEDGFTVELGYRTGEQIEEEIAVILKTAFAEAGVTLELSRLPASTLVERYTGGDIPMYFFRDMAIVPDAAYVANLWLNSASLINYSNYENEEVDNLIDSALTTTDEEKRIADMKRVQKIVVDEAPWVFLFNPGYQLAHRSNVQGFSWYTPNANNWYDFYKK